MTSNIKVLEQLSKTKKNAYFVKDSNATIIALAKELSEFWQQDLGAVTQNILLQATEFGIGSCWVGIAPNENYEQYIREKLDIPEDIRVFSMISLGYPEEVREKNNNYYEDKVHYDKY
ncbi:MAG: nitroreductase family protein [Clostridia bacterium]|nr:nitroreductase family protein [Clostridia bacterium]